MFLCHVLCSIIKHRLKFRVLWELSEKELWGVGLDVLQNTESGELTIFLKKKKTEVGKYVLAYKLFWLHETFVGNVSRSNIKFLS